MAVALQAENSLVAMTAIGNADAAHADATAVADGLRDARHFPGICACADPSHRCNRPENVDSACMRKHRRRCRHPCRVGTAIVIVSA
ncbi:hypothetical protein FZ025_10965 [Xanthomonas hyacinthi]|uniref:hypothetical protein n=1 Tax=Xanthomonas hyacinthi TaxID=56455 RepID=UPI000AE779F2|nr:hypothetical protein [Xanthomonas hyacinthi]QGY77136.1 hypothetical protein FZ025_10965 [Xanthomonas hyacinthi]